MNDSLEDPRPIAAQVAQQCLPCTAVHTDGARFGRRSSATLRVSEHESSLCTNLSRRRRLGFAALANRTFGQRTHALPLQFRLWLWNRQLLAARSHEVLCGSPASLPGTNHDLAGMQAEV